MTTPSDIETEALDTSPIFVDTNVLVYANVSTSPFYNQANEWLNYLLNVDVEIWVNRQILREYIVATLRYQKQQGTITLNSLITDVRYFETIFQVADDTPIVTDNFLTLLEQYQIGAKRIYDTNIVASMQTVRVNRLLTNNEADFVNYSSFLSVLSLQSEPKI